MSSPAVRRVLVVSFIVLVTLLSALGAQAAPHKRLLAYFPYWAQWDTPAYTSANVPYAKLTHIAHAFLALDTKNLGNIKIPEGLVDPMLIANAHASGVKVLISIGGASGSQSHAFRQISADPSLRAAFAQNLFTFVTANGYDGVDIDWEIPVAPKDTNNCIMLMQDLRNQFPSPKYLLSMAIPADPRSYGSGFDVPALAPLLDFINVMTYDFYGPWSAHAGLNSPIFQDPSDPEQVGSLATSMDLFTNTYGVPAKNLNIGTAFYGYEFNSTQNLWDACTDCGDTTFTLNYGPDIKPLINNGWGRHRDPISKVPYLLYQGKGGQSGFISYDDPISTERKVNYVLGDRGFGGIFLWSLDADYDGTSQDLLDAMYGAFQRNQK